MKEESCWRDSAPAWETVTNDIPDRVDVVVIGAGYTGLAAARALAKSGASVAVFDKLGLGDGASGRNGGQVLTGLKLGAGELIERYGRQRAKVLFTASLDAIAALERLIADESIDCDCERVGHIEAAAKPAHFEHFKAEQELLAREFDHRVDLVPRSLQDTELGTEAYHGLLIDGRSLALHPMKYLQGLARAATAAGARLHERTPVTRVKRVGVGFRVTVRRLESGVRGPGSVRGPESGGLRHRTSDVGHRTVVARDVIGCTNGYTDAALPALRRRVVPVGSYVVATEPLPSDVAARLVPRRRGVFDSKYFLHYFRLSPDARLIFGGRARFSAATPATTRTSAEILRREMIQVFPGLKDARVDYAWSGDVDFTRDMLPHAGLVDGIHYAIGYGGHGVALATYLGMRVGECLLGRQADTPFHDLRFDAIPLYNGRPWFLPFAGLYYRWKDWVS